MKDVWYKHILPKSFSHLAQMILNVCNDNAGKTAEPIHVKKSTTYTVATCDHDYGSHIISISGLQDTTYCCLFTHAIAFLHMPYACLHSKTSPHTFQRTLIISGYCRCAAATKILQTKSEKVRFKDEPVVRLRT